jgi:hypothetical protein
MTRIESHHCSVEEGSSIRRGASYHIQVFMGKGQQMQIADEFIKGCGFAKEEKLFLVLGDCDLQISGPGSVLNRSLYAAFRLAMLNTVFGRRRAKAFSISKKIYGFEKIGFPLAIQAREQICIRRRTNFQFFDIPIVKETEFCKFHA